MPSFKNTQQYSEAQLNDLGLKDLQEAFEMVVGKATKAPNKKYLIKSILAAQAERVSNDPIVAAIAESDLPDLDKQQLTAAAIESGNDAELLAEGEMNKGDEPAKDEFADMTPNDFLERAKKKGKELVKAAKQKDVQAAEPAKAKAAKDTPKKETDGLTDMDATALQALYLKEIGRPTGSTNVGYLIWKIREARKGNIKVGPAKERAPKSDKPVKVIPIRIEEDALAAMDELVAAGTYSSRMDIFRKAIAVWADMAGHTELSSLIVGKAADDHVHSHTGL